MTGVLGQEQGKVTLAMAGQRDAEAQRKCPLKAMGRVLGKDKLVSRHQSASDKQRSLPGGKDA